MPLKLIDFVEGGWVFIINREEECRQLEVAVVGVEWLKVEGIWAGSGENVSDVC